jgi:hypothetical protein
METLSNDGATAHMEDHDEENDIKLEVLKLAREYSSYTKSQAYTRAALDLLFTYDVVDSGTPESANANNQKIIQDLLKETLNLMIDPLRRGSNTLKDQYIKAITELLAESTWHYNDKEKSAATTNYKAEEILFNATRKPTDEALINAFHWNVNDDFIDYQGEFRSRGL